MRRCRFPFTPPTDLNSRSGPDVLVAALSEAFRGDPRFADLNDPAFARWLRYEPSCPEGPLRARDGWRPDDDPDVPWFPVWHETVPNLMRRNRAFAIGPNVLFGNSQTPGACGGERELMEHPHYAAVFTLSRWYSALQQKHFTQKTNHHLLDYPLPAAWLQQPWDRERTYDALVFIKGGAEEAQIGAAIARRFHAPIFLKYGEYRREQLFRTAGAARACFYVSREDHYPLAAVEIGLMGCPIISDERACPVVSHGLTGILTPVRERGESEPFTWASDAAERMAVEWQAAASLRPADVRGATIAKHSAARCRERVAAILGLNCDSKT